MLLIVGGLMGSGKSTLASELAEAFGSELISTDHIRHGLMGTSEAPAGYGEGNYRPDMRGRVYDELFRQADELLKDGQSVVLDGTFLTCCLRDRAYDLGRPKRRGEFAYAMHLPTADRVCSYSKTCGNRTK